MEKRTILIANNKTQRKYSLETEATTLGELQDQMAAQGIDFSGMTFTEGITKTQLLTRDSMLPTNVMFRGQPTNNLVMLLTNPNKQIASGAFSRKEVYAIIKEKNLQDDVKQEFKRNFTQVPTAALEEFIGSLKKEEPQGVEKEEENTPKKKTSVHPDLVELIYLTIKYQVNTHALYAEDLAVLADLLAELAARLQESKPEITDDDIYDMMEDICG